jgi:hypothetical protein
MRINIIQEGMTDRVGRTFLRGSLKSPERQIPVLMGGHSDAIVGFADDFQVDPDDGWISYDITFRVDFLEQFRRTNDNVTDWFDFSGFARNIKSATPDGMNITHAEIMDIYILPKPGFPRIHTKDTPMNDDKTAHTDRHDGGPDARAQRAIDRETTHRRFVEQVLDMRKVGNSVAEIAEVTEQPESSVLTVLSEHYGGVASPNAVRKSMGLGAVTESKDYVKLAREEVAKYINRKAEITDGFKVDVSYLYVVWFSKTLQNWKALISTSLPDGMYYEATFDGEKNKLYIDAYKKFDNESVDL